MNYRSLLLIVGTVFVVLIISWLATVERGPSAIQPRPAPAQPGQEPRPEHLQTAPQGHSKLSPPAPETQSVQVPDLAYVDAAVAEQTTRQKDLEERLRTQLSVPIHFY